MTDNPLYSFPITAIDGSSTNLAAYSGRVLLLVNVASACGYTPQYRGLERLHRDHSPRGFAVLGFPCNQFGEQEAGTEQEIQQFCSLTYDVTFPLFAKVDVNGEHAHPIWTWLKQERPGLFGTEAIKWNFTKFLVSRQGEVIRRYGSIDEPAAIERDIIAAL